MMNSNRVFFSYQRGATLRLMVGSGMFSNLSEILSVYLICKFQADPIKIKVTLMIKSNRGVFSNQEDATQRFMIQSGQFSNLPKI